jgi:hypothetical protein
MKMTGTNKTIHFKHGHLRFQNPRLEGEERIKPLYVLSPNPGDHVCSPFTAYGDYDPGATQAQVTVKSETTSTQYGGTPVIPPPSGADWAYQFIVPPDDVYDLTDVENTDPPTTYTVIGIHVDC